jgi:hypothetical protein
MSCKSLLNSFLASILDPLSCYLDALVVPLPAYHQTGFHRAFRERLIASDTMPPESHFKPFKFLTTEIPLPSTLRATQKTGPKSATASTSVVHVHGRPTEAILGGVIMGSRFPPTLRGASYLCRARMAQDFIDAVRLGTPPLLSLDMSAERTYAELKWKVGEQLASVKLYARNALGGWAKNDGDGEFTLTRSLSET